MTDRPLILYADNRPAPNQAGRLATNRLHKCNLGRYTTEAGEEIVNLQVAYRVFGTPSPTRDNLVLVFHALTGDANCAGYDDTDGHNPGWWEGVFSPAAALDLSTTCVICPNHPGSCYGSSGPLDRAVGNTRPIGLDFPELTSRDLALIHRELIRYLGIERLKAVIGGSLGGMAALEWAIECPGLAEKVVVIAAPAKSSAQALAFNHLQKKCFELDPSFKQGRYHDGPRPTLALALARQIGMVTYRNPEEFEGRFGRTLHEQRKDARTYEIQNYLDYQGSKLVQRFDANSYVKLLSVLDEHDISRNRGSRKQALQRISDKLLCVGIDSDILYTAKEVKELYELARQCGVQAHYGELISIHGHDSFLIEYEQLNQLLTEFLKSD